MQRTLVFAVLLLSLSSLPLCAQDSQDFEVFAGYSRMTGDLGLNGFEFSGAYRPSPTFGVVGDVSAHFSSGTVANVHLESNIQNYLFGPRIYFHNVTKDAKFVPFAHVLFGVSRQHTEVNTPMAVPPTTSTEDTAFTWALGGGADYAFTDRLSGRAKLDLLRTHFFGNGDSRARFAFGVVYHFGAR